MKKYKINIDRPPVTDKEIEEFKNFETVINKYKANKPNLPKLNIRNIIITSFAGVATLAVVLFIYYSAPTNDKTLGNAEVTKKEAFIKPPVPQWDVPFKSVFISVENDTVINLPSGSSIWFPKNSLEDSAGNTVLSNIEVRYREFPSPAEIFLSGIPMVYDSAGTRSTFESAAMIEIYAFSNNKPLRIKPESNVEVSLVSHSQETNYNLYYLDTVKQNWTYQGKENIDIEENKRPSWPMKKKRFSTDTAISEPANLVKPELPPLANKDKWHLELDLVKGEFPELDAYNKTIFEIDESYKTLNRTHAQKVWDDVTLKPGPTSLSYYIHFRKGKDSCEYLVKPVLTGLEYNRAKATYDSLYDAYTQALALRKENESRRSAGADSTIRVTQSEESWATTMKVIHSFTIQNFGIWNCDRIRVLPNEATINPVFTLNDTIFKQTSYLADGSSNSLTTIYPDAAIHYNKKAKNILWMVTYNNNLAVFTENDFQNLPPGVVRNTLNMRKIKTPINSADDFINLYKKGFIE